jgi:FlaG/FlaF family flagellin (archaellin)
LGLRAIAKATINATIATSAFGRFNPSSANNTPAAMGQAWPPRRSAKVSAIRPAAVRNTSSDAWSTSTS